MVWVKIECQHLIRRLSKRVGVPARRSHVHSDQLAWPEASGTDSKRDGRGC